MTTLPNGCRASKMSVYPKNWETSKASLKVKWYIKYRFYEQGKPAVQKVIKAGINTMPTLKERQQAVRWLIQNEVEQLGGGFHPVENTINGSEAMYVVDAFNYALERITVAERTKKDIEWMMRPVSKVKKLDGLMIADFRKRDIKELLTAISNSPDRYNKNRTNLMILYKELVEDEIVETNPIWDISKKKVVKRIRPTLSHEEREKVKKHLSKNHPEFFRFLQIFYHSGARISELLRLKVQDVNLKQQYFKVVVLKGREYREVKKVIKNVALPYWQDLLASSWTGQYVFSKNLTPGEKMIREDQPAKRWYRLVKKKLGITADLYSLKHSHTDEVADAIGLKAASQHNSHKGTVITMTYATGEKKRMEQEIKEAGNEF